LTKALSRIRLIRTKGRRFGNSGKYSAATCGLSATAMSDPAEIPRYVRAPFSGADFTTTKRPGYAAAGVVNRYPPCSFS